MAAGRDARLVVWDFDWSLINDNSDTFAIEQLEGKKGPAWESGRAAQAVGEIAPGWTALMDRCVASLWDAGFRRENFAKVLSTISMLPGAVEAVELIQRHGVEQRILSDANEFYIETILEAKGLGGGVFSRVVTNPGSFDGEGGRLTVSPYHPLNEHPHGCPNCPTNLCKGAVLTKWLKELAPDTKVLYVGDGSGDFCPALRLDEASIVMARSEPHDRLLRLCESARTAGDLRASLVVWNADDGGASLLRGISRFLGETD